MDILIKNMEMPKSCMACNFTHICKAIRKLERKNASQKKMYEAFVGRLTDCPLVALPSHGDLIDRDALIKDSWASYMLKKKNDDSSRAQYDTLMGYEIRNLIEDAPTIVEATE